MLIYSKYIHFSEYCKKKNKAFTLAELIVVITIATVLMSAVIIQQGKWNDQLVLNTQTYELALMIRQAQVYSLGVKEYTAGSGDKFNIGYGIYADINTPSQYILFADKDQDFKYDSGEAVETKTFSRNVTIEKLCGIISGVEKCSSPGGIEKIVISYLRPNVAPTILFLNAAGNVVASIDPYASIYIISPNGTDRQIKIESNGQISIVN